jgi:hypothetical protein
MSLPHGKRDAEAKPVQTLCEEGASLMQAWSEDGTALVRGWCGDRTIHLIVFFQQISNFRQ